MRAVERADVGAHGDTAWRVERRWISVRGTSRELRLVRFAAGWLASLDTPAGPTLGVDRSPYLAALRAAEPLGMELADVMAVVGRVAPQP